MNSSVRVKNAIDGSQIRDWCRRLVFHSRFAGISGFSHSSTFRVNDHSIALRSKPPDVPFNQNVNQVKGSLQSKLSLPLRSNAVRSFATHRVSCCSNPEINPRYSFLKSTSHSREEKHTSIDISLRALSSEHYWSQHTVPVVTNVVTSDNWRSNARVLDAGREPEDHSARGSFDGAISAQPVGNVTSVVTGHWLGTSNLTTAWTCRNPPLPPIRLPQIVLTQPTRQT